MQAMRFNFRTLCRNAAERGGQMQQRLLDALDARHSGQDPARIRY